MERISNIEYSFVLVYRKEKQNVIGYVKAKDVILQYIRSNDHTKNAIFSKLLKNKPLYSPIKVYNDSIAVEAL